MNLERISYLRGCLLPVSALVVESNELTNAQTGFELIGKRLHLSKIGHIKIKVHRALSGKVKTCTIKREGNQWYAVFTCDSVCDPTSTFHPSEEAVGVDLGVKCFAVLSTGEAIENPRFYRSAEAQAGFSPQASAHTRQALPGAGV